MLKITPHILSMSSRSVKSMKVYCGSYEGNLSTVSAVSSSKSSVISIFLVVLDYFVMPFSMPFIYFQSFSVSLYDLAIFSLGIFEMVGFERFSIWDSDYPLCLLMSGLISFKLYLKASTCGLFLGEFKLFLLREAWSFYLFKLAEEFRTSFCWVPFSGFSKLIFFPSVLERV